MESGSAACPARRRNISGHRLGHTNRWDAWLYGCILARGAPPGRLPPALHSPRNSLRDLRRSAHTRPVKCARAPLLVAVLCDRLLRHQVTHAAAWLRLRWCSIGLLPASPTNNAQPGLPSLHLQRLAAEHALLDAAGTALLPVLLQCAVSWGPCCVQSQPRSSYVFVHTPRQFPLANNSCVCAPSTTSNEPALCSQRCATSRKCDWQQRGLV